MPQEKIVHFTNRFGEGAISNIIANIVLGLERSFDFEIWSYEPTIRSPLTKEIKSHNIPLRDFGAERKLDIPALSQVYNELKGTSVNILHTHAGRSNVFGPLLGRLTSVQSVNTLHSVRKNFNPIIQALILTVGRLASITTCVSPAVEKSFFSNSTFFTKAKRINEVTHCTIPNFVNFKKIRHRVNKTDTRKKKKELGVDNYRKLLVNVGRLITAKDQATLLEAFGNLSDKKKGIGLIILGKGKRKNLLGRKARSLGIENDVFFLGFRHDIYEILACADVFVSSSLWEGMPLAHLEAMAAGVPIVSTRAVGVDEVLTNEEDALLVPLEDPQAIASATLRLLGDENLQVQVSEAARRVAENNYSLKKVVGMYEELYNKIIAS